MLNIKPKELLGDIVRKCRSKSKEINESVVGKSFELQKNGDKETKSSLEELEEKGSVTITRVYGQETDTWTVKPTQKGYEEIL